MRKNLLFPLLLSLIVIACGPDRTGTAPSVTPDLPAETEVPEKAAVEDGPFEEAAEGLVVFTSGDVFVRRDGSEDYLGIGDTVVQMDVVGTAEESYCEIQLGEIAVVRMEENSIIEMSSLLASQKGSRMAIDLDKGQVLCKVRKLLDEDSFKVQAGTVVCGVRGTEFAISAKGEADILLAVKEGAVSVVPASLERVSELAEQESSLQGVAGRIEEVSLIVGASEELLIEESAFEEFETIVPLIEEVIRKIEEKKESLRTVDKTDTEALKANESAVALIEEELNKQAADLLSVIKESPELVAPVRLEKKEISPESLETLEPMDNLELISFKPPQSRDSNETKAREEAKSVLPVLYKINITVEPADARILLSGKVMAEGDFSKLYAEGKSLYFTFQLEGYEPQNLDLIINEKSAGDYIFTLKEKKDLNASLPVETVPEESPPEPVEVSTSFSSGDFVGRIGGSVDFMVGADKTGLISAFNSSGKLLWQFRSDNTKNANSSPVVHDGRVYFSGAAELVVLNRTDGLLIARYPLAEERSHIFGREVVPFGEDIIFPANDELIVMNRDGAEKAAYGIPESSGMTPSLWNDRIVIADTKGTLLVMDSSGGNIISSVPTGSLQSVAQSPAVKGDLTVFSSRKGVVSAVNMAKGSVLWERKLDRTVFATIIAEKEGCYVYTTKRELYGLSWENGKDLFPPKSGISAAPGYDSGLLYMTDNDGIMHVVDAANGTVERSLALADSFTARPIIRGGILIAVGRGGNFYRINTEAIPRGR